MSELMDSDPHLEPPERDLAARLQAERPVPGPELRGVLKRHLAAQDPGYGHRPERLRSTVALYLAVGGATAGLGALQALGVL
jgi:hypothetical protein